ncbi:FAD/NAD(P)-binding protein [Marinomonas sp. TI.3.20]|uniref:FAD/NAD(P)-binding protein n=1 Tax=Marinomonas sp. TI.3.20 TaxID=3121296 RepID=UPI00311F82FE
MSNFSLVITGIGPWGLAVLDRLIYKAKKEVNCSFKVFIIDPNISGEGVHDTQQPDYLLLNTVTGQVNSFSAETFSNKPLDGAKTFLEWVRITHDSECQPGSFLSRKLFGMYLKYVYSTLKQNLPNNITLIEKHTCAIDIQTINDEKIRISCESGDHIDANNIFICTGHGIQTKHVENKRKNVFSPYPICKFENIIRPNETVGVMGMGLTAVDVVSSLTEGLGGSFYELPDGSLQYERSGKEPIIYSFSRIGKLFSCRPEKSLDLASKYSPIFCIPSRLSDKEVLDFKKDIFPAIAAEMLAAYSMRKASILDGEHAESALREMFSKLTPEQVLESKNTLLSHVDGFDPESLLLSKSKPKVNNPVELRNMVISHLQHDVNESLKGEALSPYKHSLEMLRVVRDFIREGVNNYRLNAESHNDFFSFIAPRISSLIVGPPVSRGREWLALIKAGVLRFDLGPNPDLHCSIEHDYWVARSTVLKTQHTHQLNYLIEGFIYNNPRDEIQSPLISNMLKNGICSLHQSRNYSSIRVDNNNHPLDATGLPVSKITILGTPSEGSTYFNHYLPSPRSRAQAFKSADRALNEMFHCHVKSEYL